MIEVREIYNGTAHDIKIITNAEFKPETRKWIVPEGIEPEVGATIPSNGMLSANVETMLVKDGIIPVFDKKIIGVDEIPGLNYSIVIVSALYASAYKILYDDYERLYTVADLVYTEDGRTILGSRGICPAF